MSKSLQIAGTKRKFIHKVNKSYIQKFTNVESQN